MYKVLLVDDEALIREAISENIPWETLGFELVKSCENGREAMELMEKNPPDLLLTDICMPYVDGIELAKYVSEHHADTLTVIISGFDEFEYAKQAVRYGVMEYIVKPITATELTEVLQKAKERLDEKQDRSKTMKKLRGAYIINKPLLQERFLNSLLRGSAYPEGLEEKMRELDISLPGCFYNTAILEGDDLSPFLSRYSGVKDELALFSICNIAQEIVADRKIGAAFQDMNEKIVLIFCGDSKEKLEADMEETLQEIRRTVKKLLLIETTAGIGFTVTDIRRLYQSFEQAKETMEQKFFLGGNRILRPEQEENRKTALPIDVPAWASRAVQAIKAGNAGEIEQAVREFAQEIRDSHISRNRTILYVQNFLLTVVNTTNLTGENENQIVETEKDLMNRIYTYDHLTDMATEVIRVCRQISDLLGEQRDSYGKRQAMLALEYIEENYRNKDLGLHSVCSHLAMSTSYFSTLFKSCTGETFIEALTKKRMEKARELLESTSMKTYEVADRVGYADPHYFSIAFKKMTGKTPTEYAKEKRRS